MAELHLNFSDSERFSIVGPDWTCRLHPWSKVPVGPLLLDAEVDGNPIQLSCVMTAERTLEFSGEYQHGR